MRKRAMALLSVIWWWKTSLYCRKCRVETRAWVPDPYYFFFLLSVPVICDCSLTWSTYWYMQVTANIRHKQLERVLWLLCCSFPFFIFWQVLKAKCVGGSVKPYLPLAGVMLTYTLSVSATLVPPPLGRIGMQVSACAPKSLTPPACF